MNSRRRRHIADARRGTRRRGAATVSPLARVAPDYRLETLALAGALNSRGGRPILEGEQRGRCPHPTPGLIAVAWSPAHIEARNDSPASRNSCRHRGLSESEKRQPIYTDGTLYLCRRLRACAHACQPPLATFFPRAASTSCVSPTFAHVRRCQSHGMSVQKSTVASKIDLPRNSNASRIRSYRAMAR